MRSSSFSQSMFTDLCERMLELCRLREDESLIVLSQGDERAEYVDAFLTAGGRLGARAMNLRLPYSSSATSGEVGVWTVGKTPLSGNRPAVEILRGAGFRKVWNLAGGINQWAERIDPTMAKY